MIGILEIVLTVMAWRRGWRARALAPFAVLAPVSFLTGAAIGVSGGSVEAAIPVFLLLDFVCVGVLWWLVAHPRRRTEPGPESSTVAQVGIPIACADSR